MENTIEIIITQLNNPQIIRIKGNIINFNKKEKFYSYVFNITDLEPNKNTIIPNSSESIGDNGTNTIIIRNKDRRKLSFWRIRQNESDTYQITSYANIAEYLMDK